mgnify:FL=1
MADVANKKYVIDLWMGVMFLLCFFSGLLRLITRGAGSGMGFLMMAVHLFSGVLLALLLFLHVRLNWDWIICMTKKRCSDNDEK